MAAGFGEQWYPGRTAARNNGSSTRTRDPREETAFLRQCILYEETAERHQLAQRITQAHRDERSVWRAVWLMALFTALAVAGLYSFPESFPASQSFLLKGLLALGLASPLCLVVFLGLWLGYRKELNRRRVECRRFIAQLLEAKLASPALAPPVNGFGRTAVTGANGWGVGTAAETRLRMPI